MTPMFETATFQTPKAQPSQSTQCAAPGSRGWRVLFGLLAMLALLLPMAPKAQAQTGHFTYQAMAGSGFNTAASVALDAKGDIFVADDLSTSVFEIVAVNGAVSTSSAVTTVGSGFSQPVSVAVDTRSSPTAAAMSPARARSTRWPRDSQPSPAWRWMASAMSTSATPAAAECTS
jgi:hypothetical protein